jgi:hypothetical protein
MLKELVLEIAQQPYEGVDRLEESIQFLDWMLPQTRYPSLNSTYTLVTIERYINEFLAPYYLCHPVVQGRDNFWTKMLNFVLTECSPGRWMYNEIMLHLPARIRCKRSVIVDFIFIHQYDLPELLHLLSLSDHPVVDDTFVAMVAKQNKEVLIKYVLSLGNPRWNYVMIEHLTTVDRLIQVALHPLTVVTPEQLRKLELKGLPQHMLVTLKYQSRNKQ